MIGRQNEIIQLEKLCEQNKTSLAVLHGRRRIGKTYLIRKLFEKHKDSCAFFEFTGKQDSSTESLISEFIYIVEEWIRISPEKEIKTWAEAFIYFKKAIDQSGIDKSKKMILFFDEIPWIDKTGKAKFLSELGHFYNTFCEKKGNVIMILCGSNASWITKKIIRDESGPWHHRVDEIIHMLPFTLAETKEFLKVEKGIACDNKTVFDYYMAIGGVAKYLSYIEGDLTYAQNINKLFFEKDSRLHREYAVLFETLFSSRDSLHSKVMAVLETKKSGFTTTKIREQIVKGSMPTLINCIKELIECGFILDVNKFGNLSKDSRYIICDPFCLFHHRWVEPIARSIILRSDNYWSKQYGSHAYSVWSGFAFEIACLNNIDLYLNARGTKGVYKNSAYWNYVSLDKEEQGAQIDILIEYENDAYEIVECKYYDDEFTISKDYAKNLKNKKQMFIKYGLNRKKYDIKMSMLTSYGTKKNSWYDNVGINNNISIDDLLS